MPNIPRVYISAIKKTSGKTTVAVAVNRLMRERGLVVQPFKKGPDFIDPMWHTQASGRYCRNLDFFFLNRKDIVGYFVDKCQGADIAVIEGNHGLFDDIRPEGGTDNASLARLLVSPVLLVIDVKEMGRTVVPVVLGCQQFDRNLTIGGVILNRVQNPRQESRIRKAIEVYTRIPVLGAIPEDEGITILQRHLGLSATLSPSDREKIVSSIADLVEGFIDLDGIISVAGRAGEIEDTGYKQMRCRRAHSVRIGVAYDEAFNFYYNDNLELLELCGGVLSFFSPLRDSSLPEVDALYIGGGFPEIFLEELEANVGIRNQVREFIMDGLPVYAECGGLVYLAREVSFERSHGKMVGVVDAGVRFSKKPVGHGYTILRPLVEDGYWWGGVSEIRGHEFHHARLDVFGFLNCAFNVERGFGVNGSCDGIVVRNSLASFTHVYSPGSPEFLLKWVEFIQSVS